MLAGQLLPQMQVSGVTSQVLSLAVDVELPAVAVRLQELGSMRGSLLLVSGLGALGQVPDITMPVSAVPASDRRVRGHTLVFNQPSGGVIRPDLWQMKGKSFRCLEVILRVWCQLRANATRHGICQTMGYLVMIAKASEIPAQKHDTQRAGAEHMTNVSSNTNWIQRATTAKASIPALWTFITTIGLWAPTRAY